jgi:hypothetical protein
MFTFLSCLVVIDQLNVRSLREGIFLQRKLRGCNV